MRVVTTINNLSRGKIDHDLNCRFELPIYQSGADVFRNFYSNFKGNAIFRNGFEIMLKHEDCALLEFRFNNEQDYLILMTANEMKFLTYDGSGNFGFVQSGGGDLVVATPYTLAESKEIAETLAQQVSQTGDLMYITHENHAPRKLTRVSATSFTLATYTRTSDPFTGAGDYPKACALYQGAAYFARSDNEKTTIWRSKIGDFDDMTTGTGDNDGFEITVAGLTEPITWLAPGANSLIAGSSQGLIPITGGSPNDPITPSNVTTKISDVDGSNDTVPVRKENLLFYINAQGRNLNYFNYDIIQESFQSKDANLTAYDITKGKMDKLVYKKDRNNLIWTIRGGNELLSLNFNLEESIVGWHEHESQADITQISRMLNNDGEVQLFGLLNYGSNYYVCRMAEQIEFPLFDEFYTGDKDADNFAYNLFIAELLKTACHLDASTKVENNYTTTITYTGDTAVGSTGTITSTGTEFVAGDVGNNIVYKTATGREYAVFEITGYTANNEVDVEVLYEPTATAYSDWYITFNTITGLTDWIGETLRVIGDGGYLGDFVVDGSGEIALGREVSVAWVGLSYDGLIKTFNLGFPTGDGINTQITPKNIYNCYIRFIFSAGGLIGSTEYDMTAIQQFNPLGYLDLPPLPIDGTSEPIPYNDDLTKNKYIYIKQDKSLPFQITGIFAEVEYSRGI